MSFLNGVTYSILIYLLLCNAMHTSLLHFILFYLCWYIVPDTYLYLILCIISYNACQRLWMLDLDDVKMHHMCVTSCLFMSCFALPVIKRNKIVHDPNTVLLIVHSILQLSLSLLLISLSSSSVNNFSLLFFLLLHCYILLLSKIKWLVS